MYQISSLSGTTRSARINCMVGYSETPSSRAREGGYCRLNREKDTELGLTVWPHSAQAWGHHERGQEPIAGSGSPPGKNNPTGPVGCDHGVPLPIRGQLVRSFAQNYDANNSIHSHIRCKPSKYQCTYSAP